MNAKPIAANQNDDDDAAWDAVLSDPENQKALKELVKNIKEGAAQDAYGDPTRVSTDPKDE